MEKIPNMISTKDLAYISDMFNWNMTAAKKIEHYLSTCTDQEVCKEFTKLNKLHLQNCQNLTKLLESSENNE